MITRVVKLTFSTDKREVFLNYFETIKDDIRSRKGCIEVHAYENAHVKGMFFTISKWESEEHLNAYRESELFGKVWPTVKAWMIEKPEAWTMDLID